MSNASNIEIYSSIGEVFVCPCDKDIDALIFLKEHGLEPLTEFFKILKNLVSAGF